MSWWHSGAAAGAAQGVHGGMALGWGAGFFGGLVMLLFLGVLILAAIWLFRALRRDGFAWPAPAAPSAQADTAAPSPGDQALAIVKERYARGEIDRETYEQMRKNLSV